MEKGKKKSKLLKCRPYNGPYKPYTSNYSFYASKPEDLTFFKEQKKKYVKARAIYVDEVCEEFKDKEYEDLHFDTLKVLCEKRRLPVKGKRGNIIERLKQHDRGEIKSPIPFEVTVFEAPILKGNYFNELVGMPHFLLR